MTTVLHSYAPDGNPQREKMRLALPSKGRMSEETLSFLKQSGFKVSRINPRQYIAEMPDIPGLEVWFQRSADVTRKVRDGDVDLGIVGYDTMLEYRGKDEEIVIIHDALGYSHCYLAVAVPEAWEDINAMADLAKLAKLRGDVRKLRVLSKYPRLTEAFFEQHGIEPYRLLYADGALEAGPHMGTADFIVDLISTGVTLRENRLKQLSDGKLLDSQATLIGNRTALIKRPELLAATRQLLEGIEAHLRAQGQLNVVANIRGGSAQEVADKVMNETALGGLQGPTVSQVFTRASEETNWYAISIVVKRKELYQAIGQLRGIGGSGVLVLPITYIFDEEPPRWRQLLETLGV